MMLPEKVESIDPINENKNNFLFENNSTFIFKDSLLENINKINSNESIDEDRDILKNRIIPNYYFFKKKEDQNINKMEEILTELKEKDNTIMCNKYDERYTFLHKIVENNEVNAPFLYSFDKILTIFKKEENKEKFADIIKKYDDNMDVKEDNSLLKKKRKRSIYNEKSNNTNELIKKEKQNNKIKNVRKNKKNTNKDTININKKRGRKTNEIKDVGVHNKMVPDNIIKKIKAKIFEYPIIFLNNIINNQKTEDKLFKLDYKFINRLNREQDLKFLDMKLKELFSKEISPKYITTKRKKDSNKKYISKILKNQKDNTILFVFNMSFRDWLDLFTSKKNIKDILFKYDDYSGKDVDCERIQKSLYGFDILLYKTMNENNKEYLTMFIFLLYNYEKWFFNKKGRKTRIK